MMQGMVRIIIENDKNEKIEILINKTATKDKLIEALYGEAHMIESKGKIILTNHLFGGR